MCRFKEWTSRALSGRQASVDNYSKAGRETQHLEEIQKHVRKGISYSCASLLHHGTYTREWKFQRCHLDFDLVILCAWCWYCSTNLQRRSCNSSRGLGDDWHSDGDHSILYAVMWGRRVLDHEPGVKPCHGEGPSLSLFPQHAIQCKLCGCANCCCCCHNHASNYISMSYFGGIYLLKIYIVWNI